MITDILSYFIAVCYICYIFWLWRCWKNAEKIRFQSGECKQNELISIVVVFRNEAENLKKLLFAIEKQSYKNYELILVNDHSTDNFSNLIPRNKHIHLINARQEGKKNGLHEGITSANGDFVLCTDADCLPCPTWAESIKNFFDATQTDMILSPVVMIPEDKAFQKMQTLEFVSLQAATAGAACASAPIMCNGANLAFRKSVWLELSDNICNNEISGDDVFMLHSFKRNGKDIQYLKSQSAMVFTHPCKTFKEFFSQRARWASKTKSYKDWQSIFAALIVFGISVVLIANLIGAFFDASHWFTFGVVFITKLIIDRIFLWSYSVFSRETYLTIWIFPLSLIYPFYIIFSAIAGLFGLYKWKR